MRDELWRGITLMSDEWIAEADAERVSAHFKRRARRARWLRVGTAALAACLCLVICLPILAMSVVSTVSNYANRINISEPKKSWILGAQSPSDPWSDRITYRLSTKKSIYKPHETPVMELSYGLTGYFGDGTLEVVIDTGGAVTSAETVYRHEINSTTYDEHEGKEAHQVRIPLAMPGAGTCGRIAITFRFYPLDPDGAIWSDDLTDGALTMKTVHFSYAVNEFETVFSRTDASDLYLKRLARLFKRGKIGAREFTDLYCKFALGDRVGIGGFTIREDGSYRFQYYSRNIRYQSPFISDPAIRDAHDANDYAQAGRLALAYMLENGVITEAEYDSELSHLEASSDVDGSVGIGFPHYISRDELLFWVLNHYLHTHE